MATTVSITNNGNGKYTIKDSDGQTRVVNQTQANAEAANARIAITPADNTGYSDNTGTSYPTGTEQTVLIKGKSTPVAEAIAQAYSAANLGTIRSNLLKYKIGRAHV